MGRLVPGGGLLPSRCSNSILCARLASSSTNTRYRKARDSAPELQGKNVVDAEGVTKALDKKGVRRGGAHPVKVKKPSATTNYSSTGVNRIHDYKVQMHNLRKGYSEQPQTEAHKDAVTVSSGREPLAGQLGARTSDFQHQSATARQIFEDFRVKPDENREALEVHRAQNRNAMEQRKREEKLHRLMVLYHQSNRFLRTPEQLDEAIDATFKEDKESLQKPNQNLENLSAAANAQGTVVGKKQPERNQQRIVQEIQDRLAGTSDGGKIGPSEILAILKDGDAFIKMQQERIRKLEISKNTV